MVYFLCESFIYFLSPTNFCTSYSSFFKREDHLSVVFSCLIFSGRDFYFITKCG